MKSIRVEWMKTRSTRTWWLLALAAVTFVALIGSVVARNVTASPMEAVTHLAEGQLHLAETPLHYLYSFAARSGYVFPFLFGALLVTNEYRYRTISQSLLLTPTRRAFMAGKLSVAAASGAVLGILCAGIGALCTAAMLSSQGLASELTTAPIVGILSRTILVYTLWALIGAALGTLVRHQAATISTVLIFTLFVEPTLTSLGNESTSLNTALKFLPGAASLSLAWPPTGSTARGVGQAAESLGWWQGGVILLAYASASAALGYLVRLRREDIT